jgi:cytosine/adenosine deaminase-related metal-dependent hydrolase
VILRARWVLPIDRPPIDGGWVAGAHGIITGVGHGAAPGPAEDLGHVALLPGLVNAHTHLELSWMAGRVAPAGSMDQWIRRLLELRREGPAGGDDEVTEAMARAAVQMHATGTVLAGDISNTLASPAAMRAAGLGGVVFHELIGFSHPDPTGAVRDAWARVATMTASLDAGAEAGPNGPPEILSAVVAHAPYSVSPALFAAILARAGDVPLSIHLGESAEEVEFLRAGTGPIRRLLEDLGVWTEDWRVPACDPVQYVADLGYLREGVLIVHGVYLTDDALVHLRRARAVLVTCPRSNVWVGGGPPRLAHLYASGVPVAIGTDSLASAPTLNLFDELAEARRLAPEVSGAALLDSATRQGARALGFGREFGTLSSGKRAGLIAVEIPAGTRDVEEYLVSGVPASSVRRVA